MIQDLIINIRFKINLKIINSCITKTTLHTIISKHLYFEVKQSMSTLA